MSVTIKTKKTSATAKLPTRGSASAAGWDLYADVSDRVVIYPGEVRTIGTGIATEIPEGYFGAVYARSGIARDKGLRPANCVAVIDSDYRGEIMVALRNDSGKIQYVEPQDRIAQIVVAPYLAVEFEEVDELSDTGRGEGGFGSTGT